MNFRPNLAQAILDGEKTETRRLLSDNPNSPWWREECAFKVGHNYAVCPGRGKKQVGRVKVLDVFRASLWSMRDADAVAEGFTDKEEFIATWCELHGDFDPALEVWVVRFELYHPYTVVSSVGGGSPVLHKDPADDLAGVREILDRHSHRSCYVIDNSDPSGFGRVPLEDVP